MDGLLGFRAVNRLRDLGPDRASVHSLLVVFVRGNLGDFRAWRTANPGTLSKLSLVDADCERKVRLLALLALCSKRSAAPIQFSEVAKELDVPESDAESWILQAVAEKLVTAKIDQVARVVRVGACQQRVFEAEQWAQLEARLTAWRSSVVALHGVMQQVAAAKPAQQQQQRQKARGTFGRGQPRSTQQQQQK